MNKIKHMGGLKLLFYVPFTLAYAGVAAIMVLIAARTPEGLFDWPNPLILVALVLPIIYWLLRRRSAKPNSAFLYIWGLVGGLLAMVGYIAVQHNYLQVGISILAFGILSLIGAILAGKRKV